MRALSGHPSMPYFLVGLPSGLFYELVDMDYAALSGSKESNELETRYGFPMD